MQRWHQFVQEPDSKIFIDVYTLRTYVPILAEFNDSQVELAYREYSDKRWGTRWLRVTPATASNFDQYLMETI